MVSQETLISKCLDYVARIEPQPLHGVGSTLPEVSPAEGYIAQKAYTAATGGRPALGVGIAYALDAAAHVRRIAAEMDGSTGRAPDATASSEPDQDGWEWAIVEVFGHRRHAGRIREVERFGAKMMRVDIPNKGDPVALGWTTHFYAGGSIFSITPAEQEACLKANKPYERAARLTVQPDTADDEDRSF